MGDFPSSCGDSAVQLRRRIADLEHALAAMGGTSDVESRPGDGATLTVTSPPGEAERS